MSMMTARELAKEVIRSSPPGMSLKLCTIQSFNTSTRMATVRLAGSDINIEASCVLDVAAGTTAICLEDRGDVLVLGNMSGSSSRRVFNVKAHGAKGDDSANDTTAIQAAIAACYNAGGGVVYLPKGIYRIHAAITVGNKVDLQGDGSAQGGGPSIIRCMTSTAGVQYGDAATPTSGGTSSGFSIDANNVATVPFYTGITIREFHNIDVYNGVDTNAIWQGTQNSFFVEFNVQGALFDGLRVDRAAGNVAIKCEFGSSGRYNVHLMSGGAALPYTVDYPLNNTFYGCLIEYHTDTTVAMLCQSAGLDNMFSDTIFATSATPTSAALTLIKVEKAGTPFSASLRLRDCHLHHNFTSVSTIGLDIGNNTSVIASGSTNFVSSHIGIRYTALSNLYNSGSFNFTLVNTKISGPAGTNLRTTHYMADLWERGAVGDINMGSQIFGDTAFRWYVDAQGAMAWGPGNAVTDLTVYRAAAGTLGVIGALTATSGIAAFGTAPPGTKPSLTGAKGGNVALANLIALLANTYGLLTDNTT